MVQGLAIVVRTRATQQLQALNDWQRTPRLSKILMPARKRIRRRAHRCGPDRAKKIAANAVNALAGHRAHQIPHVGAHH